MGLGIGIGIWWGDNSGGAAPDTYYLKTENGANMMTENNLNLITE